MNLFRPVYTKDGAKRKGRGLVGPSHGCRGAEASQHQVPGQAGRRGAGASHRPCLGAGVCGSPVTCSKSSRRVPLSEHLTDFEAVLRARGGLGGARPRPD